jgi:type I restriction enzyme S subunit
MNGANAMSNQQVKLGSVASFNPRRPAAEIAPTVNVAYVTLSTLSASSALVSPEIRNLADIEAGYCYFQDGDLLVANQLGALQDGKVAQARIGQAHGFCSKKLYVVRPDPGQLDARFLLHFLRQTRMRGLVARYLRDAVGRHPPALDFLKNLTLALPPLAEQKRLAALLDLGFECCVTRRRKIVTLDRMRQAHFTKMVGSGNPDFKRWAVATLENQLNDIILGSRRWTQYRASKGDLLIRRCNLGCNRMLLEDLTFVRPPQAESRNGALPVADAHRTRVMTGDVLMSVATHLGRTAVVPDGIGAAYVNQGVAILRSNSELEPVYLAAYLCSAAGLAEIDRVKHGGATPNLHLGAIRNLTLPLPPLVLQQQFALENGEFENERHDACIRLEEEQERFALIERATFGEKSMAGTQVTGKQSPKDLFSVILPNM